MVARDVSMTEDSAQEETSMLEYKCLQQRKETEAEEEIEIN